MNGVAECFAEKCFADAPSSMPFIAQHDWLVSSPRSAIVVSDDTTGNPETKYFSQKGCLMPMGKGSVGRDPLAQERKYYLQIKAGLLQQQEGKYALIKGCQLIGTFDAPQAAYQKGLEKLGNVPMLIVKIQSQEPTDWIPALQLGLIYASSQS